MKFSELSNYDKRVLNEAQERHSEVYIALFRPFIDKTDRDFIPCLSSMRFEIAVVYSKHLTDFNRFHPTMQRIIV